MAVLENYHKTDLVAKTVKAPTKMSRGFLLLIFAILLQSISATSPGLDLLLTC